MPQLQAKGLDHRMHERTVHFGHKRDGKNPTWIFISICINCQLCSALDLSHANFIVLIWKLRDSYSYYCDEGLKCDADLKVRQNFLLALDVCQYILGRFMNTDEFQSNRFLISCIKICQGALENCAHFL